MRIATDHVKRLACRKPIAYLFRERLRVHGFVAVAPAAPQLWPLGWRFRPSRERVCYLPSTHHIPALTIFIGAMRIFRLHPIRAMRISISLNTERHAHDQAHRHLEHHEDL